MSYASTVAFQVLYAIVPLLLAGLALLGFLGMEEAWTDGLAPDAREQLDEEVFSVVDETVTSILTERQVAWLTGGVLFTVWQVSSAVRAASGPLDRIYGTDDDRSIPRRIATSALVALAITPLLILAMGSVALGDRLPEVLGIADLAVAGVALLRWVLTAAVLLLVVWLLISFAPARRGSLKWNGIGSLLVVGSWVLVSAGFAFYLDQIADYRSVYGGLASIVVLLTYLYLLALAFFAGVQVDEVVRDRAEHDTVGGPRT